MLTDLCQCDTMIKIKIGGILMEKITVSNLLGIKVKKLFSGSEIMFIYELSKYCESLLNKKLDCKGITIEKELANCDYYGYVYSKGLSFDIKPNMDKIDLSAVSRRFFNADLGGIVFEKKTDEEWLYDYNTDKAANLVLNKYDRSCGYVNLYAYMIVSSYRDKKSVPVLFLRNSSPKQEEQEYLDILILMNYGNQFLKDKVKIQFSKQTVNQPEWEAYIMYNRQLGYMLEEVPSSVKYKYFAERFNVGDVILYYKTEKSVKSKSIRRLLNCYPCVIRSITKENVTLDYFSDITTALTRKRMLQEAELAFNNEYKWSYEDYSQFSHGSMTLSFYNIGIDRLFYTEDELLMTPFNGTDTFEQYIVNDKGIESVYHLGTLDTIYAVFEDRGIEYNKEGFLKKYFKNDKPMYDKILGR